MERMDLITNIYPITVMLPFRITAYENPQKSFYPKQTGGGISQWSDKMCSTFRIMKGFFLKEAHGEESTGIMGNIKRAVGS